MNPSCDLMLSSFVVLAFPSFLGLFDVPSRVLTVLMFWNLLKLTCYFSEEERSAIFMSASVSIDCD